MTTLEWIIAGAIAAAVVYVLVMRVFARDSREADKRIDYSKIKKMETRGVTAGAARQWHGQPDGVGHFFGAAADYGCGQSAH